ncbi:MAG: hypothetical protein H6895_05885 [Defluviimonas sp.]|uniref:hypothetical protein n=1 Tax=Albidovulum sp. TaxID=1872424 RepID=UPI002A251CAA|nr:hypothetical protein [Defluviimonas sp.]
MRPHAPLVVILSGLLASCGAPPRLAPEAARQPYPTLLPDAEIAALLPQVPATDPAAELSARAAALRARAGALRALDPGG